MNTLEDVINIIKRAIKNRVKEAYFNSQENCPVVTGNLKRSGVYNENENSCGVEYTAPYAEIVEEGIKEGIKAVAPYIKSDGTRVSGYTMNSKGREGKHFLGNEVDSTEEELEKVVDNALRGNFKVQ